MPCVILQSVSGPSFIDIYWLIIAIDQFLCGEGLLSSETLRNALIPLHSIALLLISTALKESRGLLWTLGYFCTCAIVLIPSPLIEPRYYIIPLVFFFYWTFQSNQDVRFTFKFCVLCLWTCSSLDISCTVRLFGQGAHSPTTAHLVKINKLNESWNNI